MIDLKYYGVISKYQNNFDMKSNYVILSTQISAAMMTSFCSFGKVLTGKCQILIKRLAHAGTSADTIVP